MSSPHSSFGTCRLDYAKKARTRKPTWCATIIQEKAQQPRPNRGAQPELLARPEAPKENQFGFITESVWVKAAPQHERDSGEAEVDLARRAGKEMDRIDGVQGPCTCQFGPSGLFPVCALERRNFPRRNPGDDEKPVILTPDHHPSSAPDSRIWSNCRVHRNIEELKRVG
ncbi:predicted protein [Pyrenophora tritici-repentis Pt-1C-BFP]|uniref:Uncharacterized protein n=1 Tax=Pyrenophora tritici-repentis (strain Pt-1C-BFP) TaxID=426418 RepID=B2WIU7_PYRTR|nr:uncharacterized protein PTRG_09906 [Pyrenophora tritici-repentis Pt-1C-BFP]EDU42957.1 predicted protein [Pyrenophora tritici-repentis Pt-1C-BFP]